MPAEAIDSMHVYYHQGVASWEIGLVWSAMQAAAPNLSLKTLAETAVSSGWVCPGWHKASRQLPARLLHEKLFDEEGYKGQAEQASPLIPLLRYYLHELFAPRGLLRAQRASFDCLAEIHPLALPAATRGSGRCAATAGTARSPSKALCRSLHRSLLQAKAPSPLPPRSELLALGNASGV